MKVLIMIGLSIFLWLLIMIGLYNVALWIAKYPQDGLDTPARVVYVSVCTSVSIIYIGIVTEFIDGFLSDMAEWIIKKFDL